MVGNGKLLLIYDKTMRYSVAGGEHISHWWMEPSHSVVAVGDQRYVACGLFDFDNCWWYEERDEEESTQES